MDQDDKSASVWAVAITFAILSWLTVGLRIYVRVEQIAKFGVDDKMVIFAQILFTAYLVCQMGGAAYGTGRHLVDLDMANAETALRFWFFCEIWYALATTSVKIAICLSLRRITVKPTHVLLIFGLIVWSIALGLAFLLGIIFQCTPTSDWWSLDPDHKHCLQPHTITSLTYAVSALNVGCDWTLGIFPFFIVKDLTIPTYQKIMVASILAFGAIASTATIVRMVYIPTLEETNKGADGDFLYATVPVAIWSTVEVGVGMTAICLSTLRPLLNKFVRLFRPSVNNSYDNGYSSARYSDDSHAPIPLDRSITGSAASDRASHISQDDFTAATQFNTTKPLGGGRAGSKSNTPKKNPLRDLQNSLTRFNPTKPLTNSSYDELDDDGYQSSSKYKRHGNT